MWFVFGAIRCVGFAGSRPPPKPDLSSVSIQSTLENIPFAPTLVVEALSPNTAERDIGPKFAAYEEHGVNEYWILDPEAAARLLGDHPHD